MKMPERIDPAMSAPCGMNCLVCYKHCCHKKPCAGCLNSDQGKPEHCRKCRIKDCIKERGISDCFQCPLYPCKQIKSLEKSYQTRYQTSLMANIRMIQEHGKEEFMKNQREKYLCPSCGGIISIHDKECSECQWKVEFMLGKYKIVRIGDHREAVEQAALWFHQKWGIPKETYRESMEESIENSTSVVPGWYVVYDGAKIIGGAGVIENDFHDRRDLTPNICALYVEEPYRNQGIAGEILRFVCEECREAGIEPLYLITDHTSFYERYGWEFLCMVRSAGDSAMTRMYIHKA